MGRSVLTPAVILLGRDHVATVRSREIVRVKSHYTTKVNYEYSEADRHYTDHASFGSDSWTRYHPGAALPIRSICVSALGISVPRTDDYEWVFTSVFAIFWNGMGLWIIYAVLSSACRERAVLAGGDIAVGRVTGKKIVKGKHTSYLLMVAYNAGNGDEHSTKASVTRREHDAANVGDEVTVFYDPARPRRGVVYEYCPYAVRGLEMVQNSN